MAKPTNCHTIIGSSCITDGKTTSIYRRCPHCGMVDHHYSVQRANQAHHQITRVGALLKYECGKCRKQFRVFEVCVPADVDPMTFYEKINRLLTPDAGTLLPIEGNK